MDRTVEADPKRTPSAWNSRRSTWTVPVSSLVARIVDRLAHARGAAATSPPRDRQPRRENAAIVLPDADIELLAPGVFALVN
jgi:hypothetical protein